jgi:hypothetical protein
MSSNIIHLIMAESLLRFTPVSINKDMNLRLRGSLQLLGSLDILQGFVSVAEATYLWESNSNVGSPLVLPHQSPTFSPMVDAHTR